MASEKRNIVIIGGGIIGCTSAYFITRHPSYDPYKHSVTLIEASKIAGGASGKAGGLLGLWAYPSCIVPLSFGIHEQLAKEHGGEERWGYRKIYVGSLTARGRQLDAVKNGQNGLKGNKEAVSLEKRSKESYTRQYQTPIPEDLDWFAPESVRSYNSMGDPSDTAQVHPYHFTSAMADLAAEKGCKIVLGSVKNITYNSSSSSSGVESVTYGDKETSETHTIPATDVVIAAGPWTKSVIKSAPISALRAHSVTIRPSRPVSAYAIFTDIMLPAGFGRSNEKVKKVRGGTKNVSPEIYARPNNEVYACGEGDHLVPLPPLSSDVQVDVSRCDDIIDYVSSISDELRDGEVTARQACYLPQVETSAGPLVGETGVKGLFMAAGHTCWGIQNGPGTGKLISEFVFDGGAKSASIGTLDPRKVLKM